MVIWNFPRVASLEFLREGHRVSCRAPSEMPSEDHLVWRSNGHEAVGITASWVVVSLRFSLQPTNPQISSHWTSLTGTCVSLLFKQPLAAVSGQFQNFQDGDLVDSGDPLNRTDGASLDQEAGSPLRLSQAVCTCRPGIRSSASE